MFTLDGGLILATEPAPPERPQIAGFRRVLRFERWCIVVAWEVRFWGGEWTTGSPMWAVGFALPFQFGPRHMWYDGENCVWWLGPFYVERHGYPCEKCSNALEDS